MSRNIESTCRRETVIVKGRLVEGAEQAAPINTSPVGSSVSPPLRLIQAESSNLPVEGPTDELEQLKQENRLLRQKLAATRTYGHVASPTQADRPSLPPLTPGNPSSAGLASPALPSNDLGKAAARLGLLDAGNEVSEYEVIDAVDSKRHAR